MSEDIQRSVLAHGRFRSCAATHRGAVRSRNEDSYVNRPDLRLWAVADGAGGHQRGDLASRTVAACLDSIADGLSAGEVLAHVRLALAQAHDLLREEAARRGAGAVLASTVVVLLAGGDHFACLWAGDSRAYLLRGGALTQITRDHTLVQDLIDAGRLTESEAEGHAQANVITRAIGSHLGDLELDKVTGSLCPGDRFLLCSDGICKTLRAARLRDLLGAPDGVPASDLLLAEALALAASDNITAVAVSVGEPDAEHAAG